MVFLFILLVDSLKNRSSMLHNNRFPLCHLLKQIYQTRFNETLTAEAERLLGL